MFGWLVVILVVVAIFNADKLPQIKSTIEAKTKEGVDAVKKRAKKAEEKISQAKTKKENKTNKE